MNKIINLAVGAIVASLAMYILGEGIVLWILSIENIWYSILLAIAISVVLYGVFILLSKVYKKIEAKEEIEEIKEAEKETRREKALSEIEDEERAIKEEAKAEIEGMGEEE